MGVFHSLCHFIDKTAAKALSHLLCKQPEGERRVALALSLLQKNFLEVTYNTSIYISLARTSGEGNGTPLQYFCLENPMNGGAWQAEVHGVTRSQTWPSDFTFTFHFHALGKEMATHFSVLARRIPGTGEPGGLPSMGSHRVGHDWSDLAAAATAARTSSFWKWHLLPGK